MCAILYSNDDRVSDGEFLKALNLMHHRGPDCNGHVYFCCSRLGHQRLKILDLDSRSDQPFYSQDGRYILIFNGEIYNFRELAHEYGITQRTTSDTEVVVELFARKGPAFLNLLNGMFAMVIYDTRTRDVFVARDRLGVKPLYIHSSGERLVIASEISPILYLTGITAYDEIGLRQYRKLRTFFNGRTAYAGVEMFPAGHYMHAGKQIRYWGLPEGEQDPPTDEELHALITDSVQQRLVSDVPVGSYLSGGLDSSIIATLAGQPHTWTIGFVQQNEFDWARVVSKAIQSTHHEVLITPDEFLELAKVMVQKRREPLSVPNEVLLYKMTTHVKQFNTVILSGEGADELFFGYDRIFRWAAEATTWNLEAFTKLYAYGTLHDPEIVEDALSPFIHLRKPLDIVAHFFQVAHLHGLLRRLDNSTMLCSVESRVPFVDHHPLIERMAGVSFDYRMNGGIVKAPLKRIFQKSIPQTIVNRKKIGFPVPLELIPFDRPGDTFHGIDAWLEFNLSLLKT